MLDQETIAKQLDLLAAHRRTLAVYLRQQAELGMLAPPGVVNGIAETRAEIQRIKGALREGGVPVEDEQGDEAQTIAFTSPSRLSPQEQRNRLAMLAKVKTIWIEGLLEQSLAKELRIALDLTEQPDAVDLPLNALVQELRRPPRELPTGTLIIKVFDQMSGALLILGAPGAGKTTLLLELARDLIARAEQDEGLPIPVVFNLSSWAEKRRPLKDWLIDELNQRYAVPSKVAQHWVDTDAILPLLDGLDEVAAEHRGDCVEAINLYRQEHGLVPLAVCSRIADYEALATKLRLQGAIIVQPLTQPQVDAYLERAGEKLAGVQAALRDDAELGELLETPLMLSIVTLAYAGKSSAEVQAVGTPEERRRHLFDAYIQAMFKRRSEEINYTPQQTTSCLSWLAAQMVRHSQTVFYIERIQPDWLPQQQRRYYSYAVRFLSRLIFGLFGALTFGLIGTQFGKPGDVLGGVLFFGLFGAVIGALYGALSSGLSGEQAGSVENINVTETLHWSWSDLVLVVRLKPRFVLLAWLIGGLIGGLSGALGSILLVGLIGGLSGTEREVKIKPNQGIHLSARSWLAYTLLIGVGSGLLGTLLGAQFGVPFGGFVFGLGVGLMTGLNAGLNYGSRAVMLHYTLRWFLYRNGSLPFRDRSLVPFLDYCTERIFLRKVGGGYIFVHRLLMEHFAGLERAKAQ